MSKTNEMNDFDFLFVGGGLQSCLAVLALAHLRPEARVAVVEQAPALAGNHTWCFHAADVPEVLAPIVAPAIAHRWDGYHVAFAEHGRSIDSPYAAITSTSLAAAVAALAAEPARPITLALGVAATAIAHDRVELADGRVLRAPIVIDARGPGHAPRDPNSGYQKFVGLEVELARPHGLPRPMLMDARVEQLDGFRFVYVLPLSPTRLLVEDTYYSDTPTLDDDAIAARVRAYCAEHDLPIAEIVRVERGVLPIPLDLPAAAPRDPAAPRLGGYAGGWFHPTTGYSLPIALRVAHLLATDASDAAWDRLAAAHHRQAAFALRLNRMMFRWFAPDRRHHVLARFYRLPPDTIARFYALATTRGDRLRIVVGRPPRGMSWRALITGRRAA